MKTTNPSLASIGLALTLAAGPTLLAQDAPKAPPASPAGVPEASAAAPATPKPRVQVAAPAAPAATTKEPQLRLNFRGVPLDMVLNYLSEAAGFTIVLETSVKGTVDVWSNQALSKQEAVTLLNSVLSKNGYAALQNGRTLTIVTKDEARKRDVPVKSGSNPEMIPKDDQIVTQILPVRHINAAQAQKDLAPLLPTTATITANEAGNSLVITDTQTNIRRVAEIISALDGAVSGVASLKVFPLKYADAKALATTVKELFAGSGAGGRDSRSAVASFIASRFGGGGPPGGPGGGDSGRSRGGSGNSGGAANTQVVAVADEYSNSLIVSAPDDMMSTVEELVKQVDSPVEDVTELRVFHLKNADPLEMSELLSQLFPDPDSTSNRSGSRFGGPGFVFPPFGGGDNSRSRGGGSGNSDSSQRARKQSKVIAVPDARTSAVIVTASRDLMPQISEMVLQLDSNAARKQKVFVYKLENAQVQEVEQVLRGLFESQNARNTQQQQQNNALDTRANNAAQQQGQQVQGFGTGAGGGGGLPGGGGIR